MINMRHLDLFSGIGGFSLAARWMGWETVAQVEWDKWCQKVLAKNFPNALRFGDIVEFNKMLQDGKITTDTNSNRRTNGEVRNSKTEGNERQKQLNINEGGRMGYDIGYIDIITGGFPCQPFSHAGKRKGVADERYLWPEMLRTIRILKPSFVVGENVAGLVSMDNGKTLDAILSDLENEGYQVESFIIPACAIGAWHRRDRIWIIAYANTPSDAIPRQNRKGIETKGEGVAINEQVGRRQQQTVQYEGLDDIPQHATNSLCKRYSESTRGKENKKERTVCEEEQSNRNRIRAKVNGHSNSIADTISQRGCGRDTGREYAKDVRQQPGNSQHGYWDSEPSVGRVANGIPNRVDRLKGLGNAIVPQIAFEIFKAIESVNNFVENNTYR